MQYSELTRHQMLTVLRTTGVAYLAMASDGQPYAVPMQYTLEADGETPIIRMTTSAYSLKAALLRANPQVCVAFSLMACAWVDSVLLLGTAALAPEDESLQLVIEIRAEALSGRRYYLP